VLTAVEVEIVVVVRSEITVLVIVTTVRVFCARVETCWLRLESWELTPPNWPTKLVFCSEREERLADVLMYPNETKASTIRTPTNTVVRTDAVLAGMVSVTGLAGLYPER
jgi:hypothetical protein